MKAVAECGTRSALNRHNRLGEIADEACLAADAAYQRERYAEKKRQEQEARLMTKRERA